MKDKKSASAKNDKNRRLNEERHSTNQAAISTLGLPSETITREVTRTTKHGTKVSTRIITVEKNKRASKVLRKERRRIARIELGKPVQVIATITK